VRPNREVCTHALQAVASIDACGKPEEGVYETVKTLYPHDVPEIFGEEKKTAKLLPQVHRLWPHLVGWCKLKAVETRVDTVWFQRWELNDDKSLSSLVPMSTCGRTGGWCHWARGWAPPYTRSRSAPA